MVPVNNVINREKAGPHRFRLFNPKLERGLLS